MHIPSILKGQDMPRHLVITATRVQEWAKKNNTPVMDALKNSTRKLLEYIELQHKKDIPMLTLSIPVNSDEEIQETTHFFLELAKKEEIHNNKVRIYVIGDWFGVDSDLSEAIKQAMTKTKDYDQYFLNFLVRYDGQAELVTAAKLLLKKAQLDKLKPEDLTKDLLKENLPSGAFIPPDLIIENNIKFDGSLLWDSLGTTIYLTEKYWLDFQKSDFDKALDFYNRGRKSK